MANSSAPDPSRVLGSLEARVMEDVWANGPSTVTEVRARLNESRPRRPWAVTSVSSVMVRLVEKGYLERSRTGRAHRYAAAVPREGVGRPEMRRKLAELFDTFGDDLAVAGIADAVQGHPRSKRLLGQLLVDAER